ncbi:MAG: hypothetical protein DHS20C18_01310 [Saprospiraceae bacterium]|nr:MAG: hypothetical protein DHS20C18_01310 [Saprospiraceae bacterium]
MTNLPAQNLSQSVVGNSGAFAQNNGFGNLHWTVGEVAVEQYTNTFVLDQGFHQLYTDLLVTAVWEKHGETFTINLFPNPTSGWLNLECNAPGDKQILIHNLLGQKIQAASFTDSWWHLDLSPYPTGIYLVTFRFNGEAVRTFKIQKTSI